MFRMRFICAVVAIACVMGLCVGAAALEVDCDTTYCFSPEDFSGEEALQGICITGLPDAAVGTAMLGRRVLQPGDILTADQLAQMTFAPLRSEEDQEAVVTYLPIYADRVEKVATMTISVRGKEDKAPVAQDHSLETYKNLPTWCVSLKVRSLISHWGPRRCGSLPLLWDPMHSSRALPMHSRKFVCRCMRSRSGVNGRRVAQPSSR